MGKTPHADQDQLESLLYSDETEVSSEEIALHVESCELCQQRLSDLVSLESSELEVSQWLKTSTAKILPIVQPRARSLAAPRPISLLAST